MPPVFAVFLSLLILQRIGEMLLGERNRRGAMARGGREWGSRYYPVIIAVHAIFYISLLLEWRYRSHGWNSAWPLWVGVILAAQIMRLWAIRSLGRCWNTRIIVIPGMGVVTQGPYRFIRHPNYLAVIVEMLAIPTLCGAYLTAAVFSLANAVILAQRIPQEERALEQAGGTLLPQVPRLIPRMREKR